MFESSVPSRLTGPFFGNRRAISRRRFLQAGGVSLSLPWLETMLPPLAKAAGRASTTTPRGILAICNNLGVLGEPFFPKDAGRDYTPSPYLSLLQEFRDDFT